VHSGTGQWPQKACGQEICRSWKPAVHNRVSESPPLGPVLCSAKGIRSTLPHPVSSRSVSNIPPVTFTPLLHKSPHQVSRATKFCNVESNICGSSVWNLPHVTFLAPRILRWLLDFWKIRLPWA
jgi:hypothetical protein